MSVVVLRVEGDDLEDIAARVARLASECPPVWRYRVLDLRKAFEARGGQWHVIPDVTDVHVIDLPETFRFEAGKDPGSTVLSPAKVAEIIRAGQFLWWA